MADKSIEQLTAAEKVNATDLFVLQQSGTAKKLTGQILENWLLSLADGHGGIQSITKLSTSGLADTYRITLADNTTFDFVVTNGRSIDSITQTSVSGLTRTYRIAFNDGSSQTFAVTDGRSITGISKTSTSGLVDTYTIEYNDGTTSTFIVNNGEKGDKGDNAYVWIKYASQEPTESSHSIGDIPDDWMGVYSGNASTAPTDWRQYKWFKNKGEQGDTGSPATLLSKSVTYQVGDSGSIVPSGSWGSSVPVVPQGKYLWTKTELQFNTGDPIVSYSVTRMGLDGSGSVSSVNNVSPDENGNVALNAEDVGALPSTGGDMTGELRMNGQVITGLNMPVNANDAVNKAYADKMLPKTGGTMSGAIAMGGKKITGLGTPAENTDAVNKAYVDRFRCFGSLRDIGITTFPTTMSAVAEAMPANSMMVIDTRTIMPDGSEVISDFGLTINGTAYINKGYSTARVTMMVLYGSGGANRSRILAGNWASETNTVNWMDYGFEGNEAYPGCIARDNDGTAEWVNPPMVAGTEYRTTERWKGKAVYTKAVSCGNLPSGGSYKVVEHGASATQIIRCCGCIDGRDSLPFYDPANGEIRIDSSKNNIRVCVVSWKGATDITTLTATAQIWYTKD